ncbi:hypothetical protein [Piscibacillus salipiscarius]|uniref:Uncharacterized protein n=2 Tax=Piscibacillus salipiscarius TaxID=299480 RepID=A0ABW5Q674_9BACI
MRVLFWVIVCFFIFYLGMQTANNHAEPEQNIIETEADFNQSSVTEESFNDVHDQVLSDDVESKSSSFYSIAVFLEDVVKTLFSVIFQFLYRFSAMFF